MLVGYRTYIASGLMAAFGVLASVDWNTVLQNPKGAAGLVSIAAGVFMAVLRSITTTPPGSSR
jgi:hypothetical protein